MKFVIFVFFIHQILFAGLLCDKNTFKQKEINNIKKLSEQCFKSAMDITTNSTKPCKNFIRYLEKTDQSCMLENAYYNLSSIYRNKRDFYNENNILQKLSSKNPNDPYLNLRLGFKYYLGEGKNINYIKAYQYFRKALEYGDLPRAQKMLELLCKQDAWACK